MSETRKQLKGDPCYICGEPFFEWWDYNGQCMVTDMMQIWPPGKTAHSDCIQNARIWERIKKLEAELADERKERKR